MARPAFSHASLVIPKIAFNPHLQIGSKLNVFARHDADASLAFKTTYASCQLLPRHGENTRTYNRSSDRKDTG